MAAVDGKIDRSGNQEEGAGSYTIVDHRVSWTTRYYHAKDNQERIVGTQLKSGEKLGIIGNTGNSTAPHLHIEIRKDGKPVDPDCFFNRKEIMFGK